MYNYYYNYLPDDCLIDYNTLSVSHVQFASSMETDDQEWMLSILEQTVYQPHIDSTLLYVTNKSIIINNKIIVNTTLTLC